MKQSKILAQEQQLTLTASNSLLIYSYYKKMFIVMLCLKCFISQFLHVIVHRQRCAIKKISFMYKSMQINGHFSHLVCVKMCVVS